MQFRSAIENGRAVSSKGTWHDCPNLEAYFPGYTLFAPRTEVAILYNSDLAISEVSNITFNNQSIERNIRACAVILHCGKHDISLYSYYRVPTRPRHNVADTLFAMEIIGDAAIIGGDMNLHHPLWGDAKTSTAAEGFIDSLNHSDLVLRNNGQQTRSHSGSTSAIDLTFASQSILIEDWKATNHGDESLSDHFWISFTAVFKAADASDPRRSTWNLTNGRWTQFREQLNIRAPLLASDISVAEEELHHLNHNVAQEVVELLAVRLTNAITETAASTLGFRQFRSGYSRWWSPDIKRAQQRCRQLYRRKKRVMSRRRWRDKPREWIEKQPDYVRALKDWKRARNDKCHLIRDAKRRSDVKINRATRTGKMGMKQLNRLYNPKRFRSSNKIPDFIINNDVAHPISDDSAKAELIHDILIDPPHPDYQPKHTEFHQFVERGIRKQLEDHVSNVHPPLSNAADDLECGRIQKYELDRVIRDLETDKAIGPDHIHNLFLKEASKSLKAVILRFFNLLFRSRIYPDIWNRANVSPIPKPGKDHSDPANYRPIAVSSCIGRLYERILALRFQTLAHDREWFKNWQCGFQINKCTDDLLTLFLNDAYAALDLGSHTDAIFTDFSKAYDTVWHDGLIYKLKHQVGIDGNLLHAVIAFLRGREIRVVLKNGTSSWKRVLVGLPQGSGLSPILYILFTNDYAIPASINKFVRIGLFADDTAIWTIPAQKDWIRVKKLQRALTDFNDWCCFWKLKLNPKKCKSLRITKCAEDAYEQRWRYKLPQRELERVSEFKYLGLEIDQNLSFNLHMDKIAARLESLLNRLFFIKKVGIHLDPRAVLCIYKTKGRSSIEYGAMHYFHKDTDHRMQRLQNRFLRFATGAKNTTPIDIMERLTKLEPLKQRIETLQCRHWLRTLFSPDQHPLREGLSLHVKYNSRTFQGAFGALNIRRRPNAKTSHYQCAPSQRAEGTFTRYAALLHPPLNTTQIPRMIPITAVPNYRIARWPNNYKVILRPSDPDDYRRHRHIFTDGSNMPNPGRGGHAFWDSQHRMGQARSTNYHCDILHSELKALLLYVQSLRNHQRCPKTEPTKIAVFVDNAMCLQFLNGTAYPKYAYAHGLISSILMELIRIEHDLPNTEILFLKIKAHEIGKASHAGNHKVDAMAKNAAANAFLDPAQAHMAPFSTVLYRIKQQIRLKWAGEWHKRQQKICEIYRLNPNWSSTLTALYATLNSDEAAMMVRLLTNHIELNSYYSRFNYDPNQTKDERSIHRQPCPTDLCPLCNSDRETLAHLILHCPIHESLRMTLFIDLVNIHPTISTSIRSLSAITCEMMLYPYITWPSLGMSQYIQVWRALLSFIRDTRRFIGIYGLNNENLARRR